MKFSHRVTIIIFVCIGLFSLAKSHVCHAATPSVTISAPTPATPLYATDFKFNISVANNGTTGYAPYVDFLNFYLFDFVSASYGQHLFTNQGCVAGDGYTAAVCTLNSAGCVYHPQYSYSSLSNYVCYGSGFAGYELVVLKLPLSALASTQPTASIEITGHVHYRFDLDYFARAGFELGADPFDNPETDPTIVGVLGTRSIRAPVLTLNAYSPTIQDDKFAAGPNFATNYRFTVDAPDGLAFTNLTLIDFLPNNLEYIRLISVAPGTDYEQDDVPISPGAYSPPNNDLRIRWPVFTGTSADTDASIEFNLGVPLLNASGTAVLNGSTGACAAAINQGQAIGYDTFNVIDPLTACSLITEKQVAVTSEAGPAGYSPGDVLEFTLQFKISDYFGFNNLILSDNYSDGFDFVAGFTPTLQVTEHESSTSGNFNALNFNRVGTTMTFNISDELVTRGFGVTAGELLGGCKETAGSVVDNCGFNKGATIGTIKFRLQIADTYSSGYVSEGDKIWNGFNLSSRVVGSVNSLTDTNPQQDFYIVKSGLAEKTIYAVNGSTTAPLPTAVVPGDTITYRVKYTTITSDIKNLIIDDYLALPFLHATEVDVFEGSKSATPPAVGHAQFGPSDTYKSTFGPAPTMTSDAASNRLSFDFGTLQLGTEASTVMDILFTVTVGSDPYMDDIKFVNRGVMRQTNSTGDVLTSEVADSGIFYQTPKLVLKKGLVSRADSSGASFTPTTVGPVAFTVPGSACPPPRFSGTINSTNLTTSPINSNVYNADAGDVVTYAIVVENTGQSAKGVYDIRITDTLPSDGLKEPATGYNFCVTNGAGAVLNKTITALAGAQYQFDITDNANSGALSAYSASSGQNILIITYDMEVRDVPMATPYQTSAKLNNYSNTDGGPNLTDGGPTEWDTAQVAITTPMPSQTIIRSSEAHTADASNQVGIGEIIRLRFLASLPEGTNADVRYYNDIFDNSSYNGIKFLNDGTAKVALVSNDAGITASRLNAALPGLNVTGSAANIASIRPTCVLPDANVSAAWDYNTNNDNYTRGTDVSFIFGDVINSDRDADPEYIVVEANFLVLNSYYNYYADTYYRLLLNYFRLYRAETALVNSVPIWYFIAEPHNVLSVNVNSSSSGPPPPPTTAPTAVGWWKMDEATAIHGTTLADSSGNGKAGILSTGDGSAEKSVAGKYGNALQFDGSNDYVNVNSVANDIATGNVTVSAWIYPFSSADANIFGLSDDSSTNDIYLGYFNSGIRFTVYNSGVYMASAPSIITANNWYHITGTFSQTGGMAVYKNGGLVGTNANKGRGGIVSLKAFVGRANLSSTSFDGVIDDVRVFDNALTSTEVADLYDSYQALLPSPVAHWKLDEGTGINAGDAAGSADGTITGAVWKQEVDCKFGKCLYFDGSSDYVSVADGSGSPLDSATGAGQVRSVSLWFKTSATDNAVMMEKGGNSHFVIQATNYVTSSPPNYTNCAAGKISWRVSNSVSGVGTECTTATYNDNAWHHFAGIYDGVKSIKYLDGVKDAKEYTETAPADDNNNFMIGARSGGAFSFPGLIDDVRIYNYALTPAQVTSAMNNTDNPSTPPPPTLPTIPAEDAGDEIAYQIIYTNSSAGPYDQTTAFDIRLTDLIPRAVNNLALDISAPTGVTVTNNSNLGNNSVDVSFSHLGVDNSIVLTVTGAIINTATSGFTLNNTAYLSNSSLPGSFGTTGPANETGSVVIALGAVRPPTTGSPDTEGERLYSTAASHSLELKVPYVNIATPAPQYYLIGEDIDFEIVVDLAEGRTTDLRLTDDLPGGLGYVSHQIITTSAGSTQLSANFNGTLNTTPTLISPSAPYPAASGANLILDFGTTTVTADNVLTNNQFVVKVKARVLNLIENQNGISLAATGTASYRDPDTGLVINGLSGSPAMVGIIEPRLQLYKEIEVPPAPPDIGSLMTYRLTISHHEDSLAAAKDIFLRDILPRELINPTIRQVITTDGVTDPVTAEVVNIGNSWEIWVPSDDGATFDLPLGEQVDVLVEAEIGQLYYPGQKVVNQADVYWNSLDGTHPNASARRTWSDGLYNSPGVLNDYHVMRDIAWQYTACSKKFNGQVYHGYCTLDHLCNLRPVAQIVITESGVPGSTPFKFDASASADDYTPLDQLKARWSFEYDPGNRIWNPNYADGIFADDEVSHPYATAAPYTVALQLQDSSEINSIIATQPLFISAGGGNLGIDPIAYPVTNTEYNYDFGIIDKNQTKDITMLICNLGDDVLTVNNLSFDGADYAKFSIASSTATPPFDLDADPDRPVVCSPFIDPASYEFVKLRFTPAGAVGTFLASYVITTTNNQIVTINLQAAAREAAAVSDNDPVEQVIYDGRMLINPPPGFMEFLRSLRFSDRAKPR